MKKICLCGIMVSCIVVQGAEVFASSMNALFNEAIYKEVQLQEDGRFYVTDASGESKLVNGYGEISQTPIQTTSHSLVKTVSDGSETKFVDQFTGRVLGTLPYVTSDVNSMGQFAYTDSSGLMGIGQTSDAFWVDQVAVESDVKLLVDGVLKEFQGYALLDAQGNQTNYLKLRDVAAVLNGTPAQYQVSWDGAINIIMGSAYTPNGSEFQTIFSGEQIYEINQSVTNIQGDAVDIDAIVLKDGAGSGYTYYKLRDLGELIGFRVDWNQQSQLIEVDSSKT